MTAARPGTAAAIAAAVRAGTYSAREAVELALRRIEEVDGGIEAYREVRVFAALREADLVDARPDRDRLALAGVPVAVKDNVPVTGEALRNGSAATDDTPRTSDHEVVRRLRAAGAVVVGLTNTPELCVFGTTDSAAAVTRNPWNRRVSPGGSSGGAAAAVAAATVPVAHGNDGMGSIRIPAACCGLVGLKPGSGVVPADLGNGSWFGMAENGPLATTVQDAALTFAVMADRPVAPLADPAPLRVAVSVRAPVVGTPVHPDWVAAARTTGDALAAAGHRVRTAEVPYPARLVLSQAVRWTAGTELDARLVADRSRLQVRTARHAALGRAALRLGLPREQGRTSWRSRAERFFTDHDVLVTPALAQSPPRARAWSERGWLANVWSNARYAPFAAPWNLAGWPALTLPTGEPGPTGTPLAVQLVCPPGGEDTLLALAAQLERARPWRRTVDDLG
ncbi:amidase [Jatrophihabitans endophyticus]|uniref:Amidase n=1 Tax=Jatrophihabitans endophyticus TaxID=1206085 RepID=A0A1M5HHY4_9ACTN|nr:amidase family protein [Jatrophihabitans endophyticus]SHG15508.1 amidase [Jatrophihabitans endophyticus]